MTKKKVYLSVSGGWDSTAMMLYAIEQGMQFECIAADTGFEPKEFYDHIEDMRKFAPVDLVTETYIENGEAYKHLKDYIQRTGFLPNFHARYCTRTFKIRPIVNKLKASMPCIMHIGIRYDESPDRGNTGIKGVEIGYLLRELKVTRRDVIDKCKQYNLEPKYPIHTASGGCVNCFFKTRKEIEAMYHIDRTLFDELSEIEQASITMSNRVFHMFPNLGMTLEAFAVAIHQKGALMFPIDEIYTPEADHKPCGPFCHK